MNVRVEIVAEEVTCRQDGQVAFSAPLKDFLGAVVARSEHQTFPEAIPEGVRFIRRRGDVTVLVLEERPALRTVRWLADDSPDAYGKKAVYRTARLAFPFVVLVIAFRAGALTGYQQCFYRVAPLHSWSDALFLPNLFNVANAYGQPCWLCLANLKKKLTRFSWNEKVRTIWTHVFGASFNRSSEVHEGMSYWGAMRGIDPRVASLSAWEEASKSDPFFTLRVPWQPLGKDIGRIMEEMLSAIAPPQFPDTVTGLVQVLSSISGRGAKRWPWAR